MRRLSLADASRTCILGVEEDGRGWEIPVLPSSLKDPNWPPAFWPSGEKTASFTTLWRHSKEDRLKLSTVWNPPIPPTFTLLPRRNVSLFENASDKAIAAYQPSIKTGIVELVSVSMMKSITNFDKLREIPPCHHQGWPSDRHHWP